MDGLYFNRELSWLRFNERVLAEASDPEVPLLERLRFISIFASNLDEFYMVRVGSLYDQALLGKGRDNKTGMTAPEQIAAVNAAARPLYSLRDRAFFEVNASLRGRAPYLAGFKSLEPGYRRIVKDYFTREVAPLLSPQIIDQKHPFPHLENRAVYVAASIKSKGGGQYGIIPLPAGADRVFMVPGADCYLLLEDILLRFSDIAFGGKAEEKTLLRVTRNADLGVMECLPDGGADYRCVMREILKRRPRLSPVRLELSAPAVSGTADFFLSKLGLDRGSCFYCSSPLDLSFAADAARLTGVRPHSPLLFPVVRPQRPAALACGRIMDAVQKKDILLSYPYESMNPLLELLREAGGDRNVLSIKITLYRVGQSSQLIRLLCAAAENGKDVTVMIELRARFDEENNINWSNVLEEAGCKVIYGLEDYKVHAKILLITRRSGRRVSYITHIGTGNYNETTARFYCDLNLITADEAIGLDAALFFKRLGVSDLSGPYRRLLVSPGCLKDGIMSLIRREAVNSREGRTGRIIMKMNSLTDKDVIDGLIAASQAGVKISLIIRGICCLRPGITGSTENIEVRSIVGRHLEHSRVYCFGDGEGTKLYISSADMMTRNTTRRVEIAAPVLDRDIRARIRCMLETMLKDNVKARVISPEGLYLPVADGRVPFNCQEYFHTLAAKSAAIGDKAGRSYRFNKEGIVKRFFPWLG